MKITMYKLIGLIKDGKAPKKIKYDGKIWKYSKKEETYNIDDYISLNWDYVIINCLNDEVEILEEKKILEKLETFKDENNIFLDDLCYKYKPIYKDSLSLNEQVIVDKLNEVLDYLKQKGE